MTVPMMSAAVSSVAGVAHDVRRTVSQNLNDAIAFTAEPYVPGSGTVTLKSIPKRVGPGSVLSCGEATLYVVSVGSSSAKIDVMPGYDGGPDAPIPSNAPLRVNPRFTDYTLFRVISQVVGSMASPSLGLFAVKTETRTGMATDDFYPMPAAYADKVIRVLTVESSSDNAHDWVPMRRDQMLVSYVPGNRHLRLFNDALQYKIVYAVEITPPVSYSSDLITECGLSQTMLDIPALGASATLMSGQEARRVHQRAQGDPRRSEDVPITGATAAARDLRRLFERRVDEEHTRQINLYSYRVG